MKNKRAAILAFTAMAMASDPRLFTNANASESEEYHNEKIKIFEIEKNKANGLKEFIYGNQSIWALNKKNADKKARLNNISLDSYNPPTK